MPGVHPPIHPGFIEQENGKVGNNTQAGSNLRVLTTGKQRTRESTFTIHPLFNNVTSFKTGRQGFEGYVLDNKCRKKTKTKTKCQDNLEG